MPLDIDDVIARAKLPEKTLALCLRGDLQAEWEDLERQLKAEQDDPSDDSLGGNVKARDLAERMEAIGQEMAESQIVFRFRGLSRKAYSDLCAKHKAGEDDTASVDGLNWKTYPTALIAACATDPVMTVEQAEKLSDTVTDVQWDQLFEVALSVNRGQVSVPFSLAASAIAASTGPSSKRPEPGASQGQDSLDASLFEPPSTSTTTGA